MHPSFLVAPKLPRSDTHPQANEMFAVQPKLLTRIRQATLQMGAMAGSVLFLNLNSLHLGRRATWDESKAHRSHPPRQQTTACQSASVTSTDARSGTSKLQSVG